MNIKITSLALVFILSIFSISQAQNFGNFDQVSNSGIIKFNTKSDNVDLTYADFDGNPFLKDGWITGTVLLDDGTKVEGVGIKYDILQNAVIAKSDKREVVLYNRFVNGFIDSEDNQLYKNGYNYEKMGIKPNQYLRVIYEDDEVSILEKYEVKQFVESASGYGNSQDTKRMIVQSDILMKAGDEYEDIKMKKKHILKGLPYPKSKIEDIAKSNNLDIEDEEDLNKIMKLYHKNGKS